MEYTFNNKKIEIYGTKTESNTTKITVAKDRVTIKIGERDLGLFVKEEWINIANEMAVYEVQSTHRGMFQVMPFGGHATIKTERGNNFLSVSYYRNISKVVVSESKSPYRNDGFEKLQDFVTEQYI